MTPYTKRHMMKVLWLLQKQHIWTEAEIGSKLFATEHQPSLNYARAARSLLVKMQRFGLVKRMKDGRWYVTLIGIDVTAQEARGHRALEAREASYRAKRA